MNALRRQQSPAPFNHQPEDRAMSKDPITLQVGALRLSIDCEHAPEAAPSLWYADWLLWSDVEREILVTLLRDGPRKRSALAAAIDRSEDAIKDIVGNLSAKRIILPSADGYVVNYPADRRALLLASLLGPQPGPR